MNISFDFDNTLDNPELQLSAKQFIANGDNVFIITSRKDSIINTDLLQVAIKLGIKIDNIIFTNGQSKIKSLIENNIDIHFEDCPFEIVEIQNSRLFTNCKTAVIKVVPFVNNDDINYE